MALLRELLGSEVATAVASHAEYLWAKNDDGTVDGFTHTIPKQTLSHRRGGGVVFGCVWFVVCFEVLSFVEDFGTFWRHHISFEGT